MDEDNTKFDLKWILVVLSPTAIKFAMALALAANRMRRCLHKQYFELIIVCECDKRDLD